MRSSLNRCKNHNLVVHGWEVLIHINRSRTGLNAGIASGDWTLWTCGLAWVHNHRNMRNVVRSKDYIQGQSIYV
ncbi:hypothetical protein Lal_00041565 [Lupinus albus]|nr:hypothetical protein Lal_00041565 [Lupinus albus]